MSEHVTFSLILQGFHLAYFLSLPGKLIPNYATEETLCTLKYIKRLRKKCELTLLLRMGKTCYTAEVKQ